MLNQLREQLYCSIYKVKNSEVSTDKGDLQYHQSLFQYTLFQPKASSVDLNSRKNKAMIVINACGLENKKYKFIQHK